MANPQHIEWLLEGVEAWNARRERDDFTPDLMEADIRGAFKAAGKVDDYARYDLKGVDLVGANLQEADLGGAFLGGANLERAHLGEANLSGANLKGAIFRWAYLFGAILAGADLERADLTEADLRGAILIGARLNRANIQKADLNGADGTSLILSPESMQDGYANEFTDLSNTYDLTQQQVDSMDGDSGTILPDHITRPDHWPEVESKIDSDDGASSQADTTAQTASPALRQQIAFLLRVAPSAANTALHTASQIEMAVSEARMNAQDEPALFLQVATALKSLGSALKQADDKDIEIATLEGIVASQKAEIERLTALIADMPSAKAQIMVAALGGAGATAITGTLGYMFGPEGAEMINHLWRFFNSGGGLPPPPQMLPPTISI